MTVEHGRRWRHRRGEMGLDDAAAGVAIMGIVNATPDSFSDGGRWTQLSALVDEVGRWAEAGVEVVDIGGESTRPGSVAVEPTEEARRVLPVIAALRDDPRTVDTVLSVDTRNAQTARVALAAGADIVNDVSGLADPQMASVVAEHGAALVVGHMRGTPATMMRDVVYENPFDDVCAALERSLAAALAAGVASEAVVVDPCLGFGKSAAHSAAWLHWPARLRSRLGHPVLIGASRKRFIEVAIGRKVEAADRVAGSVAAAVVAMSRGASVLRVHDVVETLHARAVVHAVGDAALRAGFGVDEPRSAAARSTTRLEPIIEWVRRRLGSGGGGLLILEGQASVLDRALWPGEAPPDGEALAPPWSSAGLGGRRRRADQELDGALVVSGLRSGPGMFARRGLICPLWPGPLPGDQPASLGLRHRAALGIASGGDAMAIVVSESRGELRVAVNGSLSAPLSERELLARLHAWLDPGSPVAAPATESR